MSEILYTRPKLAALLGVGTDVIEEMCAMGLPHLKIGERIYYDIFAVYEFIINERRNASTGKKLCRSTKSKKADTGGMILQFPGIGFEEALRLNQNQSPDA